MAIVLHVSPTGDDNSGDGSESAPYASISMALSQAIADTIHVDIEVAAGTYANPTTPLTITGANVAIWGGYDNGNWTSRNPALSPTIIAGAPVNTYSPAMDNYVAPAIIVDASASDVTIDGFVIEPGAGPSTGAQGVTCIAAAGSPTISHNVCSIDVTGGYTLGVDYAGPGAPIITDNLIRIATGGTVFGISATSASGLIARNFIQGSGAGEWAFGIDVGDPNGLAIDANVVDLGSVNPNYEGPNGIAFHGSGTTAVTNNTVRIGFGNGATDGLPNFGIGDRADGARTSSVTYTIVNNIVWSTTNCGAGSGSVLVQISSTSSFLASPNQGFDNNDLFACPTGLVSYQGVTYSALSDVNAIAGAASNLSVALTNGGGFVDDASNWRLAPGSGTPFIVTAGGLILSGTGARDADDKVRPSGTVGTLGWSLGAYQQDNLGSGDGSPWTVVSGPTQAVANHSYLVEGAAPITLTLPDASALAVGDAITVSAAGAGGVVLAAASAETFALNGGFNYWTDQPGSSGAVFQSIASDTTGTKLVAVVRNGDVWTSIDSGAHWTDQTATSAATNLNWISVASDATGTNLVALANGGDAWTSTDGGVTWVDQTTSGAATNLNWVSVASDTTGTKLAALVSGGDVWTSSDGGVTWVDQITTTAATNLFWESIASDAAGTNLVATDNADIWTSTDSGVTWSNQTAASAPHNLNWIALASDATGADLVAVTNGDIWTSHDSGVTWTDATFSSGAHNLQWRAVASDATGTHLFAATNMDIWMSSDGGVTWINATPIYGHNELWSGLASNASGSFAAAASTDGQSWTYSNDASALVGAQGATITLVYAGGGVFNAVAETAVWLVR